MKTRKAGNSGLQVSSLGLGTMTWGRDTDAIEATDMLRQFIETGGNLLDTAAAYGDGAAEELIGELLSTEFDRDQLNIVTKAGTGSHFAGNSQIDASRGNMLNTLDASLKRLGTDYVDVWLVHHHDYNTPFEETLSALQIAVNSGRVRYVGVSNYPAWASAQMSTLLKSTGIGMAAVEVEYSLLQRGVEREVIPAAEALGFGVFAWSPLARGVLTGKYRSTIPPDSRAASVHLHGFTEPYLNDRFHGLIEATVAAAEGLGRSPLEVALAWVRDAPAVSSVIAGPRTAKQMTAILRSTDLILPQKIRNVLDEISAIQVGYPERPQLT